jgi:integrase
MQLKGSSSRLCRDLDPGDHVLCIERAVHRAAGQLRFVEPKTPRSRRVPPVPQVAMAAFNAHRARQARERLAAGDSWHDGDLISASSIGTPMEPRNVNRRLNELRAKSGLDWLRLHDLRLAWPLTSSRAASNLGPSWRSSGIRPSVCRWISAAMCCLIGFVLRRPRWIA